MNRWRIDFFREKDGTEPVRDWLDNLVGEIRGKVLARINLLREHGPTLDFPYTSQIEGRLREVRLRFGKTRYRVLYFFDEDRTGVLLHGLTKDTDKLESSDKATGIARMEAHTEHLKKLKAAKSGLRARSKKGGRE
jgi:hypothetical protein